MRQGIFLPESASGADSLMASVLRECAGASISILLYLLPLIVCRHPVDDSDDELGGFCVAFLASVVLGRTFYFLAFALARTLQIPNTGRHTIVWTHKNSVQMWMCVCV